MTKSRFLAIGLALIMAFGLAACGSSSTHHAAATPVVALPVTPTTGAFSISANGGTGTAGGPGGQVVVFSAGTAQIISYGAQTYPAIAMPVGTLTISGAKTWQDADNATYSGIPGLIIAPGANVTVGAAGNAAGMNIVVLGPVVVAGNLIAAATAVAPVNVQIDAHPATAAEDSTIVVSGGINLSGNNNAAGSGYPGGILALNNAHYPGTTFGIYLGGPIASNGGNATSAAGSGGFGGVVQVTANDAAPLVIASNISLNGGNGIAGGSGGMGGTLAVQNAAPTAATGPIALFNLNSINLNGGAGTTTGAPGGVTQLRAYNSSLYLAVPIIANGGTGGTGTGGPGIVIDIRANVSAADHVANSNLVILSDMSISGGAGATNGGSGGNVMLNVVDGNLYGGGMVYANGGGATAAGSAGGPGGNYISTVTDAAASTQYFWSVERGALLNGGNAVLTGGNAGNYMSANTTKGAIFVPPAGLQVLEGSGATYGAIGTITYNGDVIFLPYMPTLFQLPL